VVFLISVEKNEKLLFKVFLLEQGLFVSELAGRNIGKSHGTFTGMNFKGLLSMPKKVYFMSLLYPHPNLNTVCIHTINMYRFIQVYVTISRVKKLFKFYCQRRNKFE